MSVVETQVFNSRERFIEGWYWALRSSELKRKATRAVSLLGRELVLYRAADGRVRALDAYCPHMGAHLAEGKVEDDQLRCLFHNWKFNGDGKCVEIPCQLSVRGVPQIKPWPTEEKYGLIWVWTGETARQPVPFVPELESQTIAAKLGGAFVKKCHPNVMMINAIDAQHFTSVHQLPVNLDLQPTVHNENHIVFRNVTRVPRSSWLTRMISAFYAGPLTYILSYWYASTGSVTIGPDFLHFHILFSLRPTADGRSEGQTILVTKKRAGLWGRAYNAVLLHLSDIVGQYFAKGDTLIFESINFKMQFPIKADAAIVSFIKHAEKQTTRKWGRWELESDDARGDEVSGAPTVPQLGIHEVETYEHRLAKSVEA
jgi:phenylpropionate dioxygenase-like ring-hydroxylating dioxygenase large terminal subunit